MQWKKLFGMRTEPEPMKVEVPKPKPKPVQPRESLIKNPTMKRDLQSIRTATAINSALGLGASFTDYNLNAIINDKLPSLMIMSRNLAMNNPIAAKYFSETANAVAGSDGIYIRPDVHLYDDEQKNIEVSQELERRFYAWAEDLEAFDIQGRFDFGTFQHMLEHERSIAGEVFIRIHTTRNGIKIEVINGIRVPTNNNQMMKDGRYISNGIEFSADGKPIAYYFMRYNPTMYAYDYTNPERVPAEEVLHYYLPSQPSQERGLPDIVTSQNLLSELDAFLEASLVTKKIGSAVMGFIENDEANKDEDNLGINDTSMPAYFDNEILEPGAIVELQPGQRLKDFSPKAATDGVAEYVDQQLTLISMGLGITKQALTGDTSGASYSASRLADKIQQNTYQVRINQLKVRVLKPLYRMWLRQELLNNNDMNLKFSDFEELVVAQYHSQRIVSLDPLKDAQYEILLLENGLKSKAEIIAESGRDPAVVLAQIEAEKRNGELDNQEDTQDDQTEQGDSEQESNA